MARGPDVALLMTPSDSFDVEHKLAYMKKDLRTQAFKSENFFFWSSS